MKRRQGEENKEETGGKRIKRRRGEESVEKVRNTSHT